jgi:hypothetical protein
MPAATFDLLDSLRFIEIGGHQQYETLELFHLRWATNGNGVDYFTLDEALEGKWIEVAEFSENGLVPQIKIINRSNRMVFLMAGEQVVGCKQNRVLNASIMVPVHSEIPFPVTCVEGGRWGYQSSVFSSGFTSSHHQRDRRCPRSLPDERRVVLRNPNQRDARVDMEVVCRGQTDSVEHCLRRTALRRQAQNAGEPQRDPDTGRCDTDH